MHTSSSHWILAAGPALMLALAAGCGGGSDFSSSGTGGAGATGGSGGAAGADGGSGAAGAAGAAAGSGGGAGAAGSGGTAGVSGSGGSSGDGGVEAGANCTDSSACNAGEYCGGDHVCHACSDVSTFQFDDPEALDQINSAHPDDYLRFPRALSEKTALLYTVGNVWASDAEIWATGDFTTGAGAALGAPVHQNGITESGPLAVPSASSGALAGMNFFFDHGITNSLSHEVLGGLMDASGTVLNLKTLPAPINIAGNSYSLAYAPSAQRVWWVATRNGAFNFDVFTASVAAGAAATATQVNLTTDPTNCAMSTVDAAPWVTPDGTLLLFNSTEYYTDCNSKGTTPDIFYVTLDAKGQATGIAHRVNVDLQNVSDLQASLSPNMCWLYFASDRNGAQKPRLYRAHRK